MIDIRLVKNFSGKSKGYAYVEFKDEVRVYGICIAGIVHDECREL